MNDDVTVTRELDLDINADELWHLVGDGDRWADWLVEDSEVEVVDGGRGTVVDDDGTTRVVRVERVDPGRGVRFTWWPADGPDLCSTVELIVLPRHEGSRLRITEVLASVRSTPSTQPTQPALHWEMRARALSACVASLVSV